MSSECGAMIVVVIVGYVIAAASEIWTIKALNYEYNAEFPTLTALVLNGYWPVQMLLYYHARHTQPAPIRKYFPWKAYALIGFSAGCVSFMRSFGINYLSGVVYVVCANTEVIFAALLSSLVLGKHVNRFQIFAIGLVIGALVFAILDPKTWKFEKGGDPQHPTSNHFAIGIALTIASRFLSAVNSILAEKMLGKNKKSPWGIHELCITQALVPSFVLPFTLLISQEQRNWSKLSDPGTPGMTVLAVILVAMSLTKLVDRTCKMCIISRKSSIFFEGVDALMKSVAGAGSFMIWSDRETDTKWNDFVSLGLIVLSLAFTVHGENVEKVHSEARKIKRDATESATDYQMLGPNEVPDIRVSTSDSGAQKGGDGSDEGFFESLQSSLASGEGFFQSLQSSLALDEDFRVSIGEMRCVD
jgi:drug/metabolite transporter (DMT)-like permease